MARILDALHRSERRDNRDVKEANARRDDVSSSSDVEEATDIPFIEIGGPTPKMQLKVARGSNLLIPTILPLARPNVEFPKPEPESVPLYHISFQPLPFPRRPERST